jgi:methionyl-tRNA synthetase
MSDKTFYVTTPIYYVNARPHIGHAYTTIVADVLARRHRLLGDDTFFLTGTDEHGQKIERSATAAGIAPQQFADQVSKSFEDLWHRMGITNNAYIRTTDPEHIRGVQKLFSELYARGFIYLASYTGAYCVSDEAFVDAPVGTPCPDCGRLLEQVTEENFFFKLSEFQRPLIDLIESNTIAITPDSRKNEVLSFLRGSYASALQKFMDDSGRFQLLAGAFLSEDGQAAIEAGYLLHSEVGEPYNPNALKDLSISRSSFTWGVPVPEPAASAAAQKHVIYVWLDALANYITALGYGSDDETLFQKFWPADLHLVGKEIIRFHCVYWPAFLLAAGLPLPKAITAHGWLLFEDSKMSKSKGNIVRTETILDAFGTLCPKPALDSTGLQPGELEKFQSGALAPGTLPAEAPQHDRDLFAADVLRYFLLREIPFGQDGSFTFDALITRYNADLANGYGNLVSRTLSMIDKYFDSAIPECNETEADTFYIAPRKESFYRPEQHEALGATEGQVVGWNLIRIGEKAEDLIGSNSFDQALAAIASGITLVDQFITSRKPWAATDTELSQGGRRSTLYTAAESIRIITALLYPILPYATARVWTQLGLGDIELAARNGELNNLEWGGLKPGTKLGPLGPIFPRADKGLAQIMTDMENPTPQDPEAEPTLTTDPAAPPRTASISEPTGTLPVGGSSAHTSGPNPTPSHAEIPASGIFANQPTPPTTDNQQPTTPQITIDDFAKIELRVAQILVAERIPKADKLLRLEVDLGPDFPRRQILSGIAEWYAPEDLIGRRIVVITNLAPRKMRGLESHGMLLAASSGENGKPVLATFGEDIALGARLK